MSLLRRSAALGVLVLAGAGLVACTSTVSGMKPAPDANNPLCANVMVNLPKSIAANAPGETLDRRWTDAQSTAAWGSPATIYFQCGVEIPAASENDCNSFQGIDWITEANPDEAPFYRMTSYGREPAIQVYFNSEVVGSVEVLSRIGKAAQDLKKTGACLDLASTAPKG